MADPTDTSVRLPGPSDRLLAALWSEAEALGFDALAVASADRLDDEYAGFLHRLEEGRLAGMNWMSAERAAVACEPRRLLPDAKSVVVLAMSYHQDRASSRESKGPTGQIASYALGRDYHNVIRPRLRRLARHIEKLSDQPIHTRLFVDSGPLAERAFARRAGLGWIGKNTLLLNRKLGSWTFLAAIVTNADLPPTREIPTNCGSCDRCLRACPTGALPEPFVLDATRCISYLTIEHRGSVPAELRPLMGDWVFGCDVCQTVCPVNRKALVGSIPEFSPREATYGTVELLPLLTMSEADFDRRFAGMAIRRARRDGFVRNVAIALGNSGDSTALPVLARTAESDPDPIVREHASWAIAQIERTTRCTSTPHAGDHDK